MGSEKIVRLLGQEYVPVAYNGFRCGTDPDAKWLEVLRGQGAYVEANSFTVATAGGKVLANDSYGAHVVAEGFEKWKKLPEADRKPGAIKVGAESPKPRLDPPAGGLIVRAYTRALKRDDKGQLARITAQDARDKSVYPPEWDPLYNEPMLDHLWLTESEGKSLVPADPRKGQKLSVPKPIQMRIFRFHLGNGTQGALETWDLEHVRRGELVLIVEETTPLVQLRLEGSAVLSSDADLSKAKMGIGARLDGRLTYDPGRKTFTRFDMVATGEHWAEKMHAYYPTPRRGRNPLGVAFELIRESTPAGRVPPWGLFNGAPDGRRYFSAGEQD